jgi:hypothetical protein
MAVESLGREQVPLHLRHVAFACARVRRAPASRQAVISQFAIQRQLGVMDLAARQRKLSRVAVGLDVSTAAGTKFIERPEFLHAVELARAHNATLMIEEIDSIVRHLDGTSAANCAIALATLDVPVLEASSQQFLKDIDSSVLLARMAMTRASRALRADGIRKGFTELEHLLWRKRPLSEPP